MTKIKTGLVAVVMLMSNLVFAQSVQEGKKFLYYERYQSAIDALEKALASKPGDPEAIYWLAQAYRENGDVPKATETLRKGMEGANGSNPLLLAGMGQMELAEGKTNDARQRFETAISLTKGKDINVLNAIGKANLEKSGDAAYAIEKLNQATLIKGFKEPDVYINLGDAYRKNSDGGGAVSSYQKAVALDPKYAEGEYKVGKVYLTQGSDQKDIFLQHFNKAVEIDPSYAPAYYDLYTYYFSRDVYKSKSFFEKYRAVADKGPALDYEEATLQFASGDFQTAITKADELLAKQGETADPRLYRLKGYSYDKLNDSVNAIKNLEIFFSKAKEGQIIPENYVTMAMLSAKFPDKQAQVDEFFNKAITSDTAQANKIDYVRKASDFFKKVGNQPKAAEWMSKVLVVNPNPGKVDIYNAGFENFKAQNYATADSIFKMYSDKYPNEVYGYYWKMRSLMLIDSTMEKGLAVPDAEKFISIAETDKVKNKSTLITAYGYLAGYNANIKKDFPKAIEYLDKIIEIDPTNPDAPKNKEILQKANKGAAQSGSAPKTSPGQSQPKSGSVNQ
ncbi:tetratricopeptide repeat protein [Pollutibacter soli]|uniref:tetratricopeptide repeat protein n=1 Tax=Pollutibacter soli TaxID=3034157 RepID=UPI0030132501